MAQNRLVLLACPARGSRCSQSVSISMTEHRRRGMAGRICVSSLHPPGRAQSVSLCCTLPDTGGGRGSVRGPARRGRSGDQTTVGQEASATRGDKSGPWKAAEHGETQGKPQGRSGWGLGGLPRDSGVPVSRIISEFIERHFPRIPPSPPPPSRTGDQGLSLDEDTGVSEDSVALVSRGMVILRDLGITGKNVSLMKSRVSYPCPRWRRSCVSGFVAGLYPYAGSRVRLLLGNQRRIEVLLIRRLCGVPAWTPFAS